MDVHGAARRSAGNVRSGQLLDVAEHESAFDRVHAVQGADATAEVVVAANRLHSEFMAGTD